VRFPCVHAVATYPGAAAGIIACSCSPSHVSLPRLGDRVGPRIVLFEACLAFTRVTACTLATSPYIVTCWSPKASTASLPPQLLRLLPAGAFCRVGLSPTGKRRLSTAHPQSCRSPSVPGRGCVETRAGKTPMSEKIRIRLLNPSRLHDRDQLPHSEQLDHSLEVVRQYVKAQLGSYFLYRFH